MYVDSVLESIGNTPLIRLKVLSSGNVFVKAEFLNPGGSIKDRVARFIIECAQRDGALKPGMVIIESTSGGSPADSILLNPSSKTEIPLRAYG